MLFSGHHGTVTIDLTGKFLQAWFKCGCKMTVQVGERRDGTKLSDATIAVPVFPCIHGRRLSVMMFPALGIIADGWIDGPFDFSGPISGGR